MNAPTRFPSTDAGLARLAAMQRDNASHQRNHRRNLVILAVSVVLGLGMIAYALHELGRAEPPRVVIDPAKLPPIRPGPAR
jgi:hypothetical protein